MTDTTITVRVPTELRDRLERIAQATRRSKSFLAKEAIERYVETESEIIEGILEALAELDAGKGIPHDEIVAEIDIMLGRDAAE